MLPEKAVKALKPSFCLPRLSALGNFTVLGSNSLTPPHHLLFILAAKQDRKLGALWKSEDSLASKLTSAKRVWNSKEELDLI